MANPPADGALLAEARRRGAKVVSEEVFGDLQLESRSGGQYRIPGWMVDWVEVLHRALAKQPSPSEIAAMKRKLVECGRRIGELEDYKPGGPMKREICCSKCAAQWRELVGKYPGEHLGFVRGSLRFGVLCDGCGRRLDGGATAVAVSLYTDARPYTSWEGEYLIPLAEESVD